MKKLFLVAALVLSISGIGFGQTVPIGGKVGDQPGAMGATNPMQLTNEGGVTTSDLHGKYHMAAIKKNLWTVATKSTTVTATTDISPLPATTGRCVEGLGNKAGSGKNLSVTHINVSTVSGTPGGPFYIDIVPNFTVAQSLTTVTACNNYTFQCGGSVGYGLGAVVPAQPAIAKMLRPLGGTAAIAAGAGLYDVDRDFNGEIVVGPNEFFCITAHATGTTQVLSSSITYEEVEVR